MKVKFVTKNSRCYCSMIDCPNKEKKERETTHYMQMDIEFRNADRAIDHEQNDYSLGMVRSIEVTLRNKPHYQSSIVGHLLPKTKVNITKKYQNWFYIQSNEKEGWVFAPCIETFEEIKQKQQIKGEIHQALICEDCFNQLDLQSFYIEQVEKKLEHHVIGNYTLGYLEAAIAMEENVDEVSSDELKKQLLDEIQSGEHGPVTRFNQEKVMENYVKKRV